jgi:hypothetical protein
MLKRAPVCGFSVKFSYIALQITAKQVSNPPKKRDFLRAKSHYRKHAFAPMIVNKKTIVGVFVFLTRKERE